MNDYRLVPMSKNIELKILIIGIGRCGTGFLAKSLQKSGIPCGHESIFNHWNEAVVAQNYSQNSFTAEAA